MIHDPVLYDRSVSTRTPVVNDNILAHEDPLEHPARLRDSLFEAGKASLERNPVVSRLRSEHYDRKLLFSAPELKTRGWTYSGIGRFLAKSDDTRPNPYYSSSGGLMRLYLISRVKAIERTLEWQEWLIESYQRKRSAARGVTTKERKLLNYVARIKIKVPIMTPEDLVNRAIAHYNDLWCDTEKRANASGSPEFLARIQVNYLRHELTRYEQHLDKIAGKTGAHEARTDLRFKIYGAIGRAYRHLTAECDRQSIERAADERLAQFGRFM